MFYTNFCFHALIIAGAEEMRYRLPKTSFKLKSLRLKELVFHSQSKPKFRAVVERVKKIISRESNRNWKIL